MVKLFTWKRAWGRLELQSVVCSYAVLFDNPCFVTPQCFCKLIVYLVERHPGIEVSVVIGDFGLN